MTAINTVLGTDCAIGAAADMATFLGSKSGYYAVISWDNTKESGDGNPDSFEDVFSRINYKAAKYCTNNPKVLGDGRQFNVAVGSQGIVTTWETGSSKTSYQLSTTFYASNSNPSIPSIADF